jgi:hypothetical protein
MSGRSYPPLRHRGVRSRMGGTSDAPTILNEFLDQAANMSMKILSSAAPSALSWRHWSARCRPATTAAIRYLPLKPWFDGLRSGKGPCCSDADGFALSDPDWESKNGHDDAVIKEPNRAGRTMVWPIKVTLWDHDSPLHSRQHDLISPSNIDASELDQQRSQRRKVPAALSYRSGSVAPLICAWLAHVPCGPCRTSRERPLTAAFPSLHRRGGPIVAWEASCSEHLCR